MSKRKLLERNEEKEEGGRVLEIYGGCGGFALGFLKTNFEIVRAFEPNEDMCNTYMKNVGRWIHCRNPNQVKYFYNEADVICGSPPCIKDSCFPIHDGAFFSDTGEHEELPKDCLIKEKLKRITLGKVYERKRKDCSDDDDNLNYDGDDEREEEKRKEKNKKKKKKKVSREQGGAEDKDALFHFLQIVAIVRPRMYVMDLPPQVIDHRDWALVFDCICFQSSLFGYTVDGIVLDAATFGVAQTRRRAYIFGRTVEEMSLLKCPTPTEDTLFIGRCAPYTTPVASGSILRTLPPPGHPPNLGLCTARIVPAKNMAQRKSPYAGKLFNGGGRPMDMSQPCNTLSQHMGGNYTPIVDQAHIDDPSVEPWFERWHKALILKEKRRPQRALPEVLPAVLPKMPNTVRRITVTEAKLLTGFDANFKFCGTLSKQFHQVGTAVSPPVAEAIAKYVKHCLK